MFASCQKNETEQKGTLTFSFSSGLNKGIKYSSKLDGTTEIPQALVISVVDNNGNYIKNMEQVPFFNMNGTYISSPISLPEGNYKLTDFIVVNNTGGVIYYLKNWLKPCNFIAGTLVSINFIDLQNGIIQDRVAFRKSNERTHCVGDEVPLSCFDRRYSGSLSGFGSADM